MFDKLMRLTGSLVAVATPLYGWSDEHRQFLTGGYKCPTCHARLLNVMGCVTANFYTADGKNVSVWEAVVRRATTVECPKCGHLWKRCGANPVSAPYGIGLLGIVETDRGEEFLGEDRRVIDNTKSSSPLTRNFTFMKGWSKSCQVDLERVQANGAELNFCATAAIALKLSSEEKLRQNYAITLGSKETATKEVSCTVSGHQKLTVVVRWKRILQHGFIQATMIGLPLRIPFYIAVGVTIDQQQIEESDAATD
jgi:hypothetical protein